MNKDQIQAIIEQKQSVIDEAKQLIKEQEEAMRVLKAEVVAEPQPIGIKEHYDERYRFYYSKTKSDIYASGRALTDTCMTYCRKMNRPFDGEAYHDVLDLIRDS